MIRRPPRSTQSRSSAASDVYKRQAFDKAIQKISLMTKECHSYDELGDMLLSEINTLIPVKSIAILAKTISGDRLSVIGKNNFETVNYRNNTFSHNLKRRDEIGQLYQNFDVMLKKLESSYKQQVEIINSISHDLKTPLTSIIGYIERLLKGSVKSDNKKIEYYNVILRKSQDIKILIEEFST